MTSQRSFLILFDVPSIKQYVFGTDRLREIRGASALLDRLNREDMGRVLKETLGGEVEPIYANGGSGQFLVHNCDADQARQACEAVLRQFMAETAGQVRPVYGLAPLEDPAGYRSSVAAAHFELRSRRELSAGFAAVPLMPLMAECASTSYLPAEGLFAIGEDEPRFLSEASQIKEKRGRVAREHGVWAQWMKHLASAGPWPAEDHWDTLRYESVVEIGEQAARRGYIGLVYADGNAIGRLVQKLDSPATYRAFSQIVDESIQEACFCALDESCRTEIKRVREAVEADNSYEPLPADILLLGGDDLLVVLPAERALDFAARAADAFQQLTKGRIDRIEDESVRQFFAQHGVRDGLTISCGVAVGRSNYPFYLLMGLAEELLRSAKRPAGDHGHHSGSVVPEACVDFHVIAGASSYGLDRLRKDDYLVKQAKRRTLRPFAISRLRHLRRSVMGLREVNFPRSKLHALLAASLHANPSQAEREIRDIFGRCRSSSAANERLALWNALANLRPDGWTFNFPWFEKEEQKALALSDIVEAFELFPSQR